MATQSQQLMSVLTQLSEGMGKLSERLDAIESGTPASEPVAASVPTRAKQTASKAVASSAQNLTAILVHGGKVKDHAAGQPVPSEGVAFLIQPQWVSKDKSGIFTNGSRCKAYLDGSPIRGSWPEAIVNAFTEDVRAAVRDAMATVDKRALIGAHKPVAETADAS